MEEDRSATKVFCWSPVNDIVDGHAQTGIWTQLWAMFNIMDTDSSEWEDLLDTTIDREQ